MKSFKRLLGKATKPFCLSSEGVVQSYNSFRVLEKALQRESCKSVGNETHVEWKIKLEPNRTSTLLGRSRPYNLISAPLPFAVASIDLLITSSASTSNGSAESSTVTASEPSIHKCVSEKNALFYFCPLRKYSCFFSQRRFSHACAHPSCAYFLICSFPSPIVIRRYESQIEGNLRDYVSDPAFLGDARGPINNDDVFFTDQRYKGP